MKFVIIIPVYNSENYIGKTIESVLNQTYKNYEIHIIDDKSSDNTWEILNKYSSNNQIKIYKNDKNLGKYKSVNNILKKTNGDLFFILDSHDILYPNKLESEFNIFNENPEILCVQSKIKKIDEITNKMIITDKYNYTLETYTYDVIHKIGYYNQNRFGGNIEYLSRFVKYLGENKLYRINKILTTAIKRSDKMNLGFIYSDDVMNQFITKMKKIHLNKKKDFFKTYKNNDLDNENNFEFDLEFYKKSYLDLDNKTNKEIKQHWETIGKKEGRLPNAKLFKQIYPNFDFNSYLEINPYNINFKSNYDIYGWIYLNDNADYYEWLKSNGYVENYKDKNEFKINEYNINKFINDENIKYIYISEEINDKNNKLFIKKITDKNKLNIYDPETDIYEKVLFYGLYNKNDYDIICLNNNKIKYLLWSDNYESFKNENYYDNIFTRILKYYDVKHLIINKKIEKIFNDIKKSYNFINLNDNLYTINNNVNELIDWNYYIKKNNLNFLKSNEEILNNILNYKNNNEMYFSFNIEKIKNLNINKLSENEIKLIRLLINKNIVKNKNTDFLNEIILLNSRLNNKSIIEEIPLYNFNNVKNNYNGDIKFVIIIPSYNNENNIRNNLISLFYQNYKNYRIIFTNDNSLDNTEKKFNELIKEFNCDDKITYIKNDKQMFQSYCKYNSYQMIKDDEIVIILDGDDWLAKNNCLEIIYNFYKKNDCKVAYSNYIVFDNINNNRIVNNGEYPLEIKKNRTYRTYPKWLISHLRTGYGYLFKNIPENYLKYNNKWLDRVTDQAEMFCVAEMAGDKISHINEVLHIYNKANSLLFLNSYYNDENSIIRKKIENHVKNILKPLSLLEYNKKTTLYIPKIFIINLEKDKDNKNKIKKMFSNTNFDYSFFKGTDGNKETKIINIYNQYLFKYENSLIPKKIVGAKEKKHLSLSSIGLIYSTINLFKYINNNFNLDHVIILEDDVYIHKNFDNLYFITKNELEGKDFIYLGFNIYSDELNNKILNKKNVKMLKISKNEKNLIYGSYSFICSRKFRNFVINIGADNIIFNNLTIDVFYNLLRNIDNQNLFPNSLTFYILSNHLFIPEVRKNGINMARDETFYTIRMIDLNDYNIN